MSYLIFGSSSNLTKSLCRKLKSMDIDYSLAGKSSEKYYYDALDDYKVLVSKINFKKYKNIIINIGLLQNKNFVDQDVDDHVNSIRINLLAVVNIIENAIRQNKNAKICVVGSESAKKGSFDTSYFLGKAALEQYIRERRIKSPFQRIFGVSPSTISDAGMTSSRKDKHVLNSYLADHPKERFLSCDEVAEVILDLFSDKFSYFTNDILELNGGKFARMQT